MFFSGDFRISGCWFLSPRPFPPVFNVSKFPSHPVTLSAPYPLPMKSSSGLRVLNTASSPGAPCQISGVHLLIFWGVKVLGINVTREGTHATAAVFEGDIIFFYGNCLGGSHMMYRILCYPLPTVQRKCSNSVAPQFHNGDTRRRKRWQVMFVCLAGALQPIFLTQRDSRRLPRSVGTHS